MADFEISFSMTRPVAEILSIGTELLTGTTVNTNAAYLGKELTRLGFKVAHQSACRDERVSIHEALRTALDRSDVIFASGGLGPTPDDITRESIADFFRVPLVFSREQCRQICQHYRRRGKKVPALVKREAYFPANAKPLLNQFGIALGFSIEMRQRIIVVLPGVPGELTRLFEGRVRNFLQRKFPKLRPKASLTVKTVGLSEPTIMKRLGPSFFKWGTFDFGIYPEVGEVSLRIYADSFPLIRRIRRHVERVLGKEVYSFSDESLEQVIGKQLSSTGRSVSLAESCTGGRIAQKLTAVPGASQYFKGGVVAYDNEVKIRALGVPTLLLRKAGAVSRQCAVAMAKGVRTQWRSTLGIAVTGIAGPTGGSRGKPVGLVYIAIASEKKSRAWEEHFGGDREQIQTRAAKKALEYLWRWTQERKSGHF